MDVRKWNDGIKITVIGTIIYCLWQVVQIYVTAVSFALNLIIPALNF